MQARTEVAMGTLVTIRIVAEASGSIHDAFDRAFGWFHQIEMRCSRFDTQSELSQLQVGVAVPVSPLLFEAVHFALKVAKETNGAFDPTLGRQMEARGYNREHSTGKAIPPRDAASAPASFRDVHLDAQNRTILLNRPLTLDLGAVAKGLAVDLAARELEPFRHFSIDAGGDLFLSGHNEKGTPWIVGIRHPRDDQALIASLQVTNKAVCTSGAYERGGHILDPRRDHPATLTASATVIADTAMLADALATAAFVLGPQKGIELLAQSGVEGLLFSSTMERYETQGLAHAA